jgi:hypothetical protein
MTIQSIGHGCAGCATHPSLLPALPAPPRRRFGTMKVIVIGGAAALLTFIAVVGVFLGVSMYKIDHAVHHVGVSAALLAQGQDDLLAVVKGPQHSEQIYVFHAKHGHTNVLMVPSKLAIKGPGGTSVPLSSVSLHAPATIIAGLRHIGIPVGHYVGVDLHAASPNSSLGKLAAGKISMTSLISNPTGTASLLEAVASHVYLGPNTSVSSLLSLMHVPTTNPVSVPTSTDARGRVVLAASGDHVLAKFL